MWGARRVVEQRMFGPYRLDQRIGRGGMGEVHQAFDTRRQRTVALKILRSELGADEDFRKRFRREALIAARLQEPHIVPIHDFGEIDGALYIDMRLVHGQDAAVVLDRDGPMPVHRAAAVIAQVADALDAAHAEGVVHRDVKPSNILLLPSGFAYLADFGIARAVLDSTSGMTVTGAALGTVLYMAPEQFAGSRIDGRADVYALACVLYELITGESPFRGGSLLTLMQAHLHAPPPRAAEMRPGIPPAIDGVIARGMAKNPADRFATAGELARAAHGAAGTAADPRSFTGPVPPGHERQGRRRGLVVAGAVAAVAAVVAISALVATLTVTANTASPTAAPVTTSASPVPTTTQPGGTTAADQELIAMLTPGILRGCEHFEPDRFTFGAIASVDCTNTGAEPATLTRLLRFATRDDFDTYLTRESTAQPTALQGAEYDQACRNEALVDVWERGRVVCQPSLGEFDLRIAWTFDEELVVVSAEGSPAFYDWWVTNRAVLQ